VQNLHLRDLAVAVKAQNGMVGLKPVTLNLYDGRIESSAVIDVRGEVPKYGVDKSIESVQAGPLLEDFTGGQTISGKLDAKANITTSGEWISELKRNSNGALELAFADGALHGFNIRQSIDNAKAKLSGDEPPPNETLKTDFSSLTLSGVVRNGVFSSRDLNLQAPLLRASGRGQADLNDETVDYLIETKLVGTVEGQQGSSADELAGLAIPVKIEGPFAGPKIDVLLDEILKSKADAEKAKLKAEIEAQKQALEEQIAAEKKALEEAKKRELEKKKEVEETRAKKKLEEKLQKLFD
jgi:AsmA protein